MSIHNGIIILKEIDYDNKIDREEMIELAADYFYNYNNGNGFKIIEHTAENYLKIRYDIKKYAEAGDYVIVYGGDNSQSFYYGWITSINGRACCVKTYSNEKQKIVKWQNIVELRKANYWGYKKLREFNKFYSRIYRTRNKI